MSYNIKRGSSYVSAMYPPGTVMGYMNTTSSEDPSGWVICDGAERNNSSGMYNNLIYLGIGTGTISSGNYTPPDLKAAFLRGAGAASDATYTGPSVRNFQEQQIINHGHNVGSHTHNSLENANEYYSFDSYNARRNTVNTDRTSGELNLANGYLLMNTATTSSTSITSESTVQGVNGGAETYPHNFGTYWILKL